MNKVSLGMLRTLQHVVDVQDLLISNINAGCKEQCLVSYTILLRKKLKFVFHNIESLRQDVLELPKGNNQDLEDLLSISRNFQQSTDNLGSLPNLQYTLTVNSVGINCTNFGATSGLDLKFNQDFVRKQSRHSFLNLSLKSNSLNITRFNAVKNRIVLLFSGQVVEVDDYFVMEALLSNSAINIDTLVADTSLVLVLELLDEKDIEIRPVAHPLAVSEILTEKLTAMFGTSYYTAPSKANEGYISYKAIDAFKGLITSEDGSSVKSFLNPKKFVARQEKLNGDTCIAKVKEEVFFITSSPASLNNLFNTGCFYASNKLLKSIGCARITSDFNNGLIKGVTHMASLISSGDISIVASSSAKGDVYSLANSLNCSIEDLSNKVETILIRGQEVQGIKVKVVLKITNAYTVENFTKVKTIDTPATLEEAYATKIANTANNLLGYNPLEVNAISRVAFSEGDVIETLSKLERNQVVKLKPALTTVTPYEFENISLSYGKKVANDFMDSLLDSDLNNKFNPVLESCSQLLTGNINVVVTESLHNLLNVFEELTRTLDVFIGEDCGSFIDSQFFKKFVTILNLDQQGWLYIKELNTHFPIGETFYDDLFKDCYEFDVDFMLNTLSKKLFNILTYFIQKPHLVTKEDVLHAMGETLKVDIQHALLNKSTGKLKTHGKYMTILPGFWLENVNDVCLLSRDLYKPNQSIKDSIRVNISKHPTIFLEAVSGFNCYSDIPNVEISSELRSIYMNTIFVHPDYLLQLQNDCDGDLARVTFDKYSLPLFKGDVMKGCMKSFHQDYIDGENNLGVNLDKTPNYIIYSPTDIAKAVKEASEAKMNVAIFTDNVHRLQGSFRTLGITDHLITTLGIEQTSAILKDVIVLMSTLIQTDAMNSIKHDGQASLGSLLTSSEIKKNSAEVLVAKVKEYLSLYSVEVHPEFPEALVNIMLNVHSVDSKGDFEYLNNQIERLVFKDSPRILFKYRDLSGNEKVGSRLLLLKGLFQESWNITGDKSMFATFFTKFFSKY